MIIPGMRFRSATLMILIALIALGLGGYQALRVALEQAKIDQAMTVLRFWRPEMDMSRFDAHLAAKSADGAFQQVAFTDKGTGQTTMVTIPLAGRRSPVPAIVPPVPSSGTLVPHLISPTP